MIRVVDKESKATFNERTNSSKYTQAPILLLFSPKFLELGVDIGRELVARGICSYIDGFCTGGETTVNKVRSGLAECAGEVVNIEEKEFSWIQKDVDLAAIKDLENELGNEIIGRTITSDRRIGRGLVSGGMVRPSYLADAVMFRPITTPIAYVSRLYEFISKYLEERKPRAVFLYAVAGAPAFLLAHVCVARSVPFTRYVRARIESRMIIDNDPLGLFGSVKETMERERSGRVKLHCERIEAREHLKNFRSKPAPPEYSNYNTMVRKSSGVARQTWLLAKVLARTVLFFNYENPKQSFQEIRRATFSANIAWNRQFSTGRHFIREVPYNMRWIYFPLHVEPEASTMILSPWNTNQLAVIESLAKGAPSDSIVVVKEHEPMLGRRPKGFYRAIAAMPRVVLVGPERPGLWWIERSTVTAVISGTAAWEALRLKKPALIIGNSPFRLLEEGIVHETCLANMANALRRVMEQKPPSDEAIESFMAAMLYLSFPFKSSLLWGDYSNHATDEKDAVVKATCDGISRHTKSADEQIRC